MDVLRRLAVLAQGANGCRDRLVVRDERACVAGGAEVLGRVEAERRKRSRRTGAQAVAYRAMCLAGVLDEEQASCLGNPPQRQQVGCMTVEVDRQQCSSLPPDCRCRSGRIEAVVVLGDVGDDRHRARLRHRLERRHERRRRNDHLVTGLDPGGEQPEAQRVEAARDTDALRGPAVVSERALELPHRRPVRERAGVEQPGDVLQEHIAKRPRAWAEVVEGDAEPRRGRRCDRHHQEARGRVRGLPRA